MIEPFLWLVLGVLSGWIGYLCTKTPHTSSSTPHLLTGVITALCVGYTTRDLGSIAPHSIIAFNINSILFAFIISGITVAAVGIFTGNTRQH